MPLLSQMSCCTKCRDLAHGKNKLVNTDYFALTSATALAINQPEQGLNYLTSYGGNGNELNGRKSNEIL